MGAALEVAWTNPASLDRVLGRLVDPARDYLRLHFVAAEWIGAEVERCSCEPHVGRLLRACLAFRQAVVFAALSSKLDPIALIRELSTAGDAELRRDPQFQGDGALLEVLNRMRLLDSRLQAVVGRAPLIAAGPQFGPYVQIIVGLDAILLLTLRAAAGAPTDREPLMAAIESLLTKAESMVDQVVLPAIGPSRLPPVDPENLPRTALQPIDFESAVEGGFAEERVSEARRLLALGLRWYPDDPGLRELEAQIAAPRVRTRPPALGAREERRRSRAWVDDHAAEFAGRWVAVSDGRLLASATRADELLAATKLPRLPPGTLVVRVARAG